MKLNRCPNNKSTAKVADIADDNRASSASAPSRLSMPASVRRLIGIGLTGYHEREPPTYMPAPATAAPSLHDAGQTIAFRGLLGWAFRPRNFMKNGGAGAFACQLLIRARAVGRRKRLPHQRHQLDRVKAGFSTLSRFPEAIPNRSRGWTGREACPT